LGTLCWWMDGWRSAKEWDDEGGWMKKGKEEVDVWSWHMENGEPVDLWCFLTHLCITHRVPTSYNIMQWHIEKLKHPRI
jgi:hypothetical protein